jgi:hypothetical protein
VRAFLSSAARRRFTDYAILNYEDGRNLRISGIDTQSWEGEPVDAGDSALHEKPGYDAREPLTFGTKKADA